MHQLPSPRLSSRAHASSERQLEMPAEASHVVAESPRGSHGDWQMEPWGWVILTLFSATENSGQVLGGGVGQLVSDK